MVNGQRPTTDLLLVLACAHGCCSVTGSTGVRQRPTPEPPARGYDFLARSANKFWVIKFYFDITLSLFWH